MTSTRSGITDLTGTFEYEEGEVIEFSIGDLVLGAVTAQTALTLFDLKAAQPLTEVHAIRAALANPTSSFTAAVNTVRTLYSLDEDQRLDNGINISADVANLFTSPGLDFNLEPMRFAYAEDVQALLSAASRSLMPLEVALGQYYREDNIQLVEDGIALARQVTIETVLADDGQLTVLNSTNFTYDALGNLTRQQQTDFDALVSSVDFDYDAQGLRVRQATDFNGDGQIDFQSRVLRNLAGDVTQISSGSANALSSDQSSVSIRYNALGQEIERKSDQNADGAFDSSLTTQYASNGRPERIEFDANGDGIVDSVTVNVYDARGRLTGQSFTGAGTDDHVFLDSQPPPFGVSAIDGFEPAAAYWGNVAAFLPVESPAPSSVARRTTYLRDAQGRVTQRTTDANGDDVPDTTARLAFVDGRPSAWFYDRDGDGIFESQARYLYSPVGVLERVEETRGQTQQDTPTTLTRVIESGEDGTPDRRFVRITTTSNDPGRPSSEVVSIFFSDGRRLSTLTVEGQNQSEVTFWEPSFRLDNSQSFGLPLIDIDPYRMAFRDTGEAVVTNSENTRIGSWQGGDEVDLSLHFEGLNTTYTARLILSRLSSNPPGFDIFYREPVVACNRLTASAALVPANDDGSRPDGAYYRLDDNQIYIADPMGEPRRARVQSAYRARADGCSNADTAEQEGLFYRLAPTDLVITYPLTIEGIDNPVEPQFGLVD